jgi:hypothetical protein
MKKIVIIFILTGVTGICMPAMANNAILKSDTTIQHVNTVKRRIIKKRRKIASGHVSTTRSQRAQIQLRQAKKHLKEDKKADSAQNAVKKEQHP